MPYNPTKQPIYLSQPIHISMSYIFINLSVRPSQIYFSLFISLCLTYLSIYLSQHVHACLCVCLSARTHTHTHTHTHIYIYIVLFGPVKPELGVIPSGQENHSKPEHLNFPGRELNELILQSNTFFKKNQKLVTLGLQKHITGWK